jgi:hypothetical protein
MQSIIIKRDRIAFVKQLKERSLLLKLNQAKPLPRLHSDQIINSPSRPPAANC